MLFLPAHGDNHAFNWFGRRNSVADCSAHSNVAIKKRRDCTWALLSNSSLFISLDYSRQWTERLSRLLFGVMLVYAIRLNLEIWECGCWRFYNWKSIHCTVISVEATVVLEAHFSQSLYYISFRFKPFVILPTEPQRPNKNPWASFNLNCRVIPLCITVLQIRHCWLHKARDVLITKN